MIFLKKYYDRDLNKKTPKFLGCFRETFITLELFYHFYIMIPVIQNKIYNLILIKKSQLVQLFGKKKKKSNIIGINNFGHLTKLKIILNKVLHGTKHISQETV